MIFDYYKHRKYIKFSFSQSGEDLIVDYIFSARGLLKPSYIDIGAHHPLFLSNTAYFYKKGSRGVNIEPDPTLFEKFITNRKGDTNLNIGIGTHKGKQKFYLMASPTMNTFSKIEADKLVCDHNMNIREVISIPVDTLSNVIDKYCEGKFPDFLSLDVEGLDFDILRSLDYSKTSPIIICVETITYSATGKGEKDLPLINFLLANNYYLYADTNINSIFVKRSFWEQ